MINKINNKNRKKIKKSFMKQKKNQNLSDREKEKIYNNLVKLVKTLD